MSLKSARLLFLKIHNLQKKMDRNSKTSKKKKSLALNKKIKTNKRIIDQKPKNKSRVVITKLKGRRHNLQNSSSNFFNLFCKFTSFIFINNF